MTLLVDICIEDERWLDTRLTLCAAQAAEAAMRGLDLDPVGFEISLLACGDDRIAALNSEFRGKPSPTNVLSWPSEDRAAATPGTRPTLPAPGTPEMPQELGDIAIAYDTCRREADLAGIPFDAHVSHLTVHAVLHLLGYDHETDPDAALMEGLEIEILGRIGVTNPYLCDQGRTILDERHG